MMNVIQRKAVSAGAGRSTVCHAVWNISTSTSLPYWLRFSSRPTEPHSLQRDAFYTFTACPSESSRRGEDACQRRPSSRRLFGRMEWPAPRAGCRAALLRAQSHRSPPCDVTAAIIISAWCRFYRDGKWTRFVVVKFLVTVRFHPLRFRKMLPTCGCW